MAGLRDGLVALGYREREDFVIGVRFTQGQHARLPAAAHDLVRTGVDLLFVTSALPAQAAQRATTQIPIVFAWVEDPVGLGLVQSFAQPGGNMTGVTNLTIELASKRLELFRDLVPGLHRVLYPYDATHAPSVALAHVYRMPPATSGLSWWSNRCGRKRRCRRCSPRCGSARSMGSCNRPPSP